MVRAKFVVTELKQSWWQGQGHTGSAVVFSVAQGEENKTWSKYTPSGRIEMTVDNPAALEQFKLGQAYFVDFTPAPAKEADEKK